MKPSKTEIRKAVDHIKKHQRKWNKRLIKMQEKCKHTDVIKVPGANTGNWDPNDDWYWYDCTCPDCDKQWTEDQ